MSYNYTGTYNNTTTYYLGDIVKYNKITFLCINDNSGSGITEEPYNSVYWVSYKPEINVVTNDIVYISTKLPNRFSSDDYSYKSIKKPKIDKIELPKDDDYKKGYMYRYFYRQLNNEKSEVNEISKKEFDKIAGYYFYSSLKVMWKIIGNKNVALKTNLKIIRDSEIKLKGIKNILLKNPLQYWKNIPDIVSEDIDVTDKIITSQKNKVYKLTQQFIDYIKNKKIRSSAAYNLIKNEFVTETEAVAIDAGVLEFSAIPDTSRYLSTENGDFIITEDYQAIIVETRT